MKFPFEAIVTSEEQTKEIANEFSEILKGGDVVLLNGTLGTGKTFFVKAILENFEIPNVSSPTFAIVNEYDAENLKFYHFDFYRINREYELYDIGIEDYLSDENAVTFIEWAELFPDVVFNARYEILFEFYGIKNRKIKIKKL